MTTEPEPIVLDWSKHTVDPLPMDGGGLKRAKRCRLCSKPVWMRDEHGQPCHKVCAEAELVERPLADDPRTQPLADVGADHIYRDAA